MPPNQVVSNETLPKPRFYRYLREQAVESLQMFNQGVLCYENAPHHNEWNGLLDGSYKQDEAGNIVPVPLDQRVYNKWIMLEAPRSHAKSTSFTTNYPLWLITKNPNIRIIIVSQTHTQSESFLREITTQLERNDNIKKVFGNLVPQMPEKWTSKEIIVDRSNTKIKDPTVSATSVGGTVLSRRADIIICDDILNQENSRTAEQRQKVEDWFWKVLLPVLEPNGQLIVVGTAWNVEDLYEKLLVNKNFDVRKRYKAVVDEEQKKVLWPSRWSFETLMKLKDSMGSVAFNQAYQNEALAAEDAVFQFEWIKRAKDRGLNRTLMQYMDYASWDLGKLTITCGIDLAISQKDTSDYTAMAVIGRTKEGMKIPLFLLREKLTPAQTKNWVLSINERFQPDVFMVENNAYQEAMRRDLADTTDLPIRGYTTGGEKFDIDIGINSIAVEFENDKWILPYSDTDPKTRTLMDHLTDGMMRFPQGHTEDLLMALWFANNAMRDLTSRSGGMTTGSLGNLLG